jgi:hypothetical protein
MIATCCGIFNPSLILLHPFHPVTHNTALFPVPVKIIFLKSREKRFRDSGSVYMRKGGTDFSPLPRFSLL